MIVSIYMYFMCTLHNEETWHFIKLAMQKYETFEWFWMNAHDLKVNSSTMLSRNILKPYQIITV